MGEHRQVQLAIWLERSPQRSSAIAPGPGGAGYQLARRTGDVVHYLLFPNSAAAQQAVTDLDGTGLRVQPGIAATIRGWYVECWSADDATDHEIRRLAEFAASVGGEYDGGERVEGPVWGPHGNPVIDIVTGTGATKTLFRPVGQAELDLIERSGWRRFPPRLPGQPIFYPVLNAEYATTIARRWNTKDAASGHVGYVLRFEVEADFAARYPVQRAGGAMCEELWVPAEELDEFNDHIRGLIIVVAEHRAED
jgi:hypothetical protein